MFHIKQIPPCYLAKVVGEKGKPSFTQEESDDGFLIQWIPLREAIKLLRADNTKNPEGKLYIVPRDKSFLEKVIESKQL